MSILSRNAFLQRLIGLTGLGSLSYAQVQSYRKIYLFQSFVAGFRFHKGMELLQRMSKNDPLEMRREPDNEHDRFAVALYWQQEKIGYLPAADNEMMARLLDAEALPLLAFITHINREVQPWENLAIAVCLLQSKDKLLAKHATYLTAQQTPSYRTKKSTKPTEEHLPDVLLEYNNIIALNDIDDEEAKAYFKRHYFDVHPLYVNGEPYALVKDDGIYTYMYNVEATQWTKADDGNTYLEFEFFEDRLV